MKIGGFQKMTLLDYPGKIGCIVFTPGCNFRCPFCHNASLVNEDCDSFSEEEIFSYLNKRSGIIEGVVVSGGEPFLQKDLESFLEKLKKMQLSVKVDTNGSFPERLIGAVQAGLVDYVAMDIKNCREKYAETSGTKHINLDAIEKSVSFLLSGSVDYEFRTTVVRELHTEDDIEKIGGWIKGAERYFLQGFKDSGCLLGNGFSAHSDEVMQSFLDKILPFVPSAALR